MSTRSRRADITPYAFEPSGGATLAVTSTTGRVALGGSGDQVLVSNPGLVPVYVELGDSAVVATVASTCILPGSQVLLTIPFSTAETKATHIAAITASASAAATIQATTGWGL